MLQRLIDVSVQKSVAADLIGAAVLTLQLGCASQPEPYTPRTPDIVRGASSGSPYDVAGSPASWENVPPIDVDNDPNVGSATPVEAMVGQIAGQPIFAHHVLDGMEEQLATLGRRLPISAFRQQAMSLIFEQVRGLVQDALIQDEANRSLGPQQQAGLEAFVAGQRQELLRKHGQGSLALAERRILEQTGKTLQQNLRDIRTQIIISSYLDRNLKPLINVTRRDIERFYRDNYETFNPPTKREIQLIYADTEEDASYFLHRLHGGDPFNQLGLDQRNTYPGKAMTIPIESSDSMFGPNIDPAVQGLAEGEWAGPLPNRGKQWFIYMAKLEQPESRSLFEAQVDIERALRTRQERELQIELGEKLRKSASFTDETRMAEAVLDIAVARYASP